MVENWEQILQELYENDPELASRSTAKKINAKRLAKALNIEDKKLNLVLSSLKEQGLIKGKRKLRLTKKGAHHYGRLFSGSDLNKGVAFFTFSVVLATVFNFINWTNAINSWILLEVYILIMIVFGFLAFNFWK